MTDCLKVLTAAALALGLSACSGADVVTEGQDEIAISVEDEDDLGSATDEANEYCQESERQAVLIRVDELGEGGVAYFECE